MRIRRTGAVALAALVAALAAPASAFAHAALLHTSPSASVTVNVPPKEVQLTYSEAVEPRFAVVSVTDPNATQQTADEVLSALEAVLSERPVLEAVAAG